VIAVVSVEVHPDGRPSYWYERGPVPPLAETTKVTACPRSKDPILALNPVIAGSGLTAKVRRLLTTVKPLESVALTSIRNTAAVLGEQERTLLFSELQPVGRPDQA
jgi:hypothetical protein